MIETDPPADDYRPLLSRRNCGISRNAARLASLLAAWILLAPVATAEDARTTSELLADEARAQALTIAGPITDTERNAIAALLDAATSVDPDNVAAHTWRYELALHADDTAAGRRALNGILAADPNHETAFAAWVEQGAAETQRVEQRIAWLESLFSDARAPYQEALVAARLARLHWLRGDSDEARHYLRRALNICPQSPEARVFALELAEYAAREGTPGAEREALAAALALLRLRPLDAALAWEVGRRADEQGLPDFALRFYQHVERLEGREPGIMPAEAPLVLSQNALLRGDADTAFQFAQTATLTMSGTYEPYFYLHWLLAERDPAEADNLKAQLADAFAELKDPARWPLRAVAEAAWFYVWVDAQPQRAALLAGAARERAPEDAAVQRVLAWSKYRSGDAEEALALVEPLVADDPFAAALAAVIHADQGAADAARAAWALPVWHNYIGPALALRPDNRRTTEADASATTDAPPATQPADSSTTEPATQPAAASDADGAEPLDADDPAAVRAAYRIQLVPNDEMLRLMQRWDFGALHFVRNPQEFIRVEMEIDERNVRVGEPWRVRFRVRNVGERPITLGPDWMVNPVFLLSVRLDGPEVRRFPEVFSLSLDRKRMLRPNEFVEMTRTIDVGEIASANARWPQHLVGVTVDALFDPLQRASGEWSSNLPQVRVRPLAFARGPAVAEPSAWHLRFERLRSARKQDVFNTLAALGRLLGETQRYALDPDSLPYRPQPIPTQKVIAALRSAIATGDADVRVHALEALQAAGLNRTLLEAVQDSLEHPSWVVRMAAARQYARLGESASPRLRSLAESDPSELVRAVARQLIAEVAPPPATMPAGGGAAPAAAPQDGRGG